MGELIMLKFSFRDDGSCLVLAPVHHSSWHWSKDQVQATLRVAQVCMESRNTHMPCDCTACQLWSAYRVHRNGERDPT